MSRAGRIMVGDFKTQPVEAAATHEPRINRSFEVRDRHGRIYGATVARGSHTFRECTPEELAARWPQYHQLPAGTWFFYRPHATRNGNAYGACQRELYFATAADRDAAVERYLRDAEKRARKVAGKGVRS